MYKAWFPLTHRWLDFLDVEVSVDPDGAFTARLLVPGHASGGRRLDGFHGRWQARNGLVITAIAVPPP